MEKHETAILALYFYLLSKNKTNEDVTKKVTEIKKKYGWSDEKLIRVAEECYKEITSWRG